MSIKTFDGCPCHPFIGGDPRMRPDDITHTLGDIRGIIDEGSFDNVPAPEGIEPAFDIHPGEGSLSSEDVQTQVVGLTGVDWWRRV